MKKRETLQEKRIREAEENIEEKLDNGQIGGAILGNQLKNAEIYNPHWRRTGSESS
jgi:hypothetical protein